MADAEQAHRSAVRPLARSAVGARSPRGDSFARGPCARLISPSRAVARLRLVAPASASKEPASTQARARARVCAFDCRPTGLQLSATSHSASRSATLLAQRHVQKCSSTSRSHSARSRATRDDLAALAAAAARRHAAQRRVAQRRHAARLAHALQRHARGAVVRRVVEPEEAVRARGELSRRRARRARAERETVERARRRVCEAPLAVRVAAAALRGAQRVRVPALLPAAVAQRERRARPVAEADVRDERRRARAADPCTRSTAWLRPLGRGRRVLADRADVERDDEAERDEQRGVRVDDERSSTRRAPRTRGARSRARRGSGGAPPGAPGARPRACRGSRTRRGRRARPGGA